ncbi:LLM class flavin-dependent oxidoreductase [Nocardioides humi]|uniref:LLM class flavin-dependent oxidoreductase n=1 Tax=Nocardioides humi TaxID=449461 RepID=A0ABN1ZX12_9ACTN|nr:LLM class flavin-dependent oxidoreductase [Nocardioides humi]
MVQVGVLYQGIAGMRPSAAGRWVEELGYDSVWVGDHVLFYVDGLTTAMALGSGTERITVGNAILLVPLRDPALLARALVSIQSEMPGRYVLGAGAGGDVPAEFEVTGRSLAGRGRRMEETLANVREAFAGTILGEEFDAAGTTCPPFWFGGRTPRAAARAATIGDGFIPYLVTPAHYADLLEQVGSARAAGPRAERPWTRGLDVMVSVGTTGEQAWRDAEAYRAYGLDDDQLRRHTVLGTLDDVAAGLRRFVEVGAEHLILHVTAPADRKTEQIELLASILDTIRQPGRAPDQEGNNDEH